MSVAHNVSRVGHCRTLSRSVAGKSSAEECGETCMVQRKPLFEFLSHLVPLRSFLFERFYSNSSQTQASRVTGIGSTVIAQGRRCEGSKGPGRWQAPGSSIQRTSYAGTRSLFDR